MYGTWEFIISGPTAMYGTRELKMHIKQWILSTQWRLDQGNRFFWKSMNSLILKIRIWKTLYSKRYNSTQLDKRINEEDTDARKVSILTISFFVFAAKSKGLKGTVVDRICNFLDGGLFEILSTVSSFSKLISVKVWFPLKWNQEISEIQ